MSFDYTTLQVQPVIEEMARTGVCIVDVTLFVDKITIVDVVSPDQTDPRQAYRMFLTDGESTIQGT